MCVCHISPPHTHTHHTGMILSVCIADHLLWCVSGRDMFGFHTAKHNWWSLSQSPSALRDLIFLPRLCCCSKNGSNCVHKTPPAHQDACNPTSNYKALQWRLVTHLQTRVLHPLGGSASAACHWQFRGIKVMRRCSSILSMPVRGQTSVGDNGERFPWGRTDLLRGSKEADQRDQTSPGRV